MNKVIFILIFFASFCCLGQSETKLLYDSAKNTQNLELAKAVKKMAHDYNEQEILADTYFLIGYLHKKQDNLYESVTNYFSALKGYRELHIEDQIANTLENIANVYYLTGFYETALDYYFDALAIKSKFADHSSLSQLNSHIARQFHRLEKYDEALKYYSESIIYANKADDDKRLCWIYDDIGTVYRKMNLIDESKAAYEMALQHSSGPTDAGRIFNNLGFLYLTQNDSVMATNHFKKSLKLLAFDSPNRVIGTLHSNLATLYATKDSDSAYWFYEQSYKSFKESHIAMSQEYFGVCKTLKNLSKERGDLELALTYSDDIDQLASELLALRVQLKDLYNQYQVEAATYKFHHDEKSAALEKQLLIGRYITIALIILVIMLGAMLVVLYNKNRKINFARDTARKIYQVIHS